jgi:GST-like protein
MARPAVIKGMDLGQEHRRNLAEDKDAQKVLFGQRSR